MSKSFPVLLAVLVLGGASTVASAQQRMERLETQVRAAQEEAALTSSAA